MKEIEADFTEKSSIQKLLFLLLLIRLDEKKGIKGKVFIFTLTF